MGKRFHTISSVKFWAEEHGHLMLKQKDNIGAVDYDTRLTFVSPSGNVVNFLFNSAAECVDVYGEGHL